MPRKSLTERIAKEKLKMQQAKARLQTLEARGRSQLKKNETRTKILIGAWILDSWKGLEEKPVDAELKKLEAFLTRDKDKALVPETVKRLLGFSEHEAK